MNSEKFVDEDFVKFIELSPTIIMGSTVHDFLPLPYSYVAESHKITHQTA